MADGNGRQSAELEALETREWIDSMDYVLRHQGPQRAGTLLQELRQHVVQTGVRLPFTATTPYINTIPTEEQPPFPGSQEIERRVKEIDTGEEKGIPAERVMKEARRALNEARRVPSARRK